ncbi:MAG: hypothetical protein EAS52_08005 [Parapedobacter sp.]|nr:MAG: hypothetical protein EAS52_08005 [Parapedobacter sp.]
MMLREIITPKKRSVTVQLPEEMVGKTVEVIAFEIETAKKEPSRAQRLRRIEALTKSSLVDLSGFSFDRNEANDYDG